MLVSSVSLRTRLLLGLLACFLVFKGQANVRYLFAETSVDSIPGSVPLFNPKTTYPGGTNKRFAQLKVTGYTNWGSRDIFSCSDLETIDTVGVSTSTIIDDDLLDVAASVVHPLIDYSGQEKGLTFAATVRNTWSRTSTSSVWLQEYGVYLTVSRVFFYDKGNRNWSVISFIRGQIHDAEWNHLEGYQLLWQGENITFPHIFDIPIPYNPGGGFVGPEDPRIIIEHDQPEAEPVILFNMISDAKTLIRSMYVFRPFSGMTLKLTYDPAIQSEKNWSPFFLTPNISPSGSKRWPSRWLHLIYDYETLTIVRCHLSSGVCTRVFHNEPPANFEEQHRYRGGVIRGGSNFEPLHNENRPGIKSFVGFPRTHIEEGCSGSDLPTYRPEITILSTNTSHYWIEYSSEALTFGSAILNSTELNDPCVSSRILMINSIARFNGIPELDEMVVTYSVNDAITGTIGIWGLGQLVSSLPQIDGLMWHDSVLPMSLNVSHRLLGCSIESATDYAKNHTTFDMWEIQQEKDEARKKEQSISGDEKGRKGEIEEEDDKF